MAQYRNGIKTRSLITAPVDENYNYQFWIQKGRGRYPNFDEDTKESHLESLFALEYDESRLREIHRKDSEAGGDVYGPNTHSYYLRPVIIEKAFLRRVKVALQEANIPCSFIAQGVCARAGKQAWGFKTIGYFIKAEQNAVLLKLMGIEQIIEDVWKSLEDEVEGRYQEYLVEKRRVDAIHAAIYIANNDRMRAQQAIKNAAANRSWAHVQIEKSDKEEAAALIELQKADDEIKRLKETL